MKRDMELLRRIVLKIEEKENGKSERWTHAEIDNCSLEEFNSHFKLLIDEDYIDAEMMDDLRFGYVIMVKDLKWNGHEFLKAVRSEAIWNKTKDFFKLKGMMLGEVPIEVVKDVAIQMMKEKLGIG